jgi:hypothetical protein
MIALQAMKKVEITDKKIYTVFFDSSCSNFLTDIVLGDNRFDLSKDPELTDIIVFGKDDYKYLTQSPIFQIYKNKSICITEFYSPSFFIPSIYSNNQKKPFLGGSRIETMNYPLTQLKDWSNWLKLSKDLPSTKKYLYSFLGGSTAFVRKRLFKHYDNIKNKSEFSDYIIEATDYYEHWNYEPNYLEKKLINTKRYWSIMNQSKYILCPRGAGVSSIRLFESLRLGIAPVILSNDWIPPKDVNWSFAIFIKEKNIKEIDSIIRNQSSEWEERGREALKVFETYYSNSAVSNTLYKSILRLHKNRNPSKEFFIKKIFPLINIKKDLENFTFQKLKFLILKIFKILNIKFPYKLNRSIEYQINKEKNKTI